ncbi:hypothetical protein [Actinocorallia longicatena]|uniref:Uncharacterized protein n=1 Tax=Actinocorallia longicatena TaxID=111803 RepID=A0ABP6Q7I1_9ACTN
MDDSELQTGPGSGDPASGDPSASDPGFFSSLGSGSMLGQLRLTFLALMPMPVLVAAMSPFIVRIETHHLDAPPVWAEAAVIALALAVLLVVRRLPPPLSPDLAPDRVAAAASSSFRATLFLRFAMTEAVVLAGLPLSMVSDSLVPMTVAFGLGFPLMLALSLPTRGTIERIRERLEHNGLTTDLWATLLGPFPGRAKASPTS